MKNEDNFTLTLKYIYSITIPPLVVLSLGFYSFSFCYKSGFFRWIFPRVSWQRFDTVFGRILKMWSKEVGVSLIFKTDLRI